MTDLCANEIRVNPLVQQCRDIRFSSLVRGSVRDSQIFTDAGELAADVVRRLDVKQQPKKEGYSHGLYFTTT